MSKKRKNVESVVQFLHFKIANEHFHCKTITHMSCYTYNIILQESHAVAVKPRDAAVNSDRYRVRWHFAGAISVSRMQSVSGCTVYA